MRKIWQLWDVIMHMEVTSTEKFNNTGFQWTECKKNFLFRLKQNKQKKQRDPL